MIYNQYGFPEPSVDLKYAGVRIFSLGITGNFYPHYLLSKIRETTGDKEYNIPKGGLFGPVICPHYLFEILGLIGVSCISQTLYALSFTAGITIYSIGRSYGTRTEDFPRDIKSLVPYIF